MGSLTHGSRRGLVSSFPWYNTMGSKVLFRRGGRPWARPDSKESRACILDRPPALFSQKIAAITWIVWKKGVRFDAEHLISQAA